MNDIVIDIMKLISNNGYEVYIVGGYVRDYLLGINSNDYDICTNAKIDELKIILNNYDFEIELNTIKMKINDITIDITPYRKELKYEGRKPIEYIYTNSLQEDLKRRDYTINTICMDFENNIIDLLNGIEDLNNGIIRCVGDIDKKIKEDPLRILRCIRFSAKYNFKIDEELDNYIINNANLVTSLSYDRKKEEIEKIINYKQLEILKKYNMDKYLELDLSNIKYYNDDVITFIRIDINNNYCNSKKDKNIKKIMNIVDLEGITNYNLYKYGLLLCSIYDVNKKEYDNLIIHNRKEINITSKEIINIVGSNKIEYIYVMLEKAILNKELDNNYKKIIDYIYKIC